ncbi:PHP domain-containing protein [Natronomonas salsuginis]|nr:PHP domain-containing protein [Natronomonas salsuginis]
MHSKYSFDSFMSPNRIIYTAKIRDLSVISVTDHGNMDIYANEFSRENRERILEKHGVFVIPGMEIETNRGDIIGLFLDKEVSGNGFESVVEQIREMDGIVVLPHPYHRDCDPADLLSHIDLIEVVNGRCKSVQNERAGELGDENDVPIIGGSDAHMYWEVGQIRTVLSNEASDSNYDKTALLLDAEREVSGSPLPYLLTHGISFVSGRLKNLVEGTRS